MAKLSAVIVVHDGERMKNKASLVVAQEISSVLGIAVRVLVKELNDEEITSCADSVIILFDARPFVPNWARPLRHCYVVRRSAADFRDEAEREASEILEDLTRRTPACVVNVGGNADSRKRFALR